MTDPLAILFGGQARVKLLRFFLFNPTTEFPFEEISRRARLVRRTARTEISALERAGVIRRKYIYAEVPGRTKKVRVEGYLLNGKFPQLASLQTFFFETTPIDAKTLLRHLRKAGALDFVAMGGIFMRDFDRRIDLLVGMKQPSDARIEAAIRSLESEIGIEIRYASFSTEDLLYRVGMYDKLTRDVFDYPHKILVDRVGVKDELSGR